MVLKNSWSRIKAAFFLLVLFLVLVISFVYWDLSHYWGSNEAKELASVSTQRLGPQHYSLKLEVPGQLPVYFDLRGDMWQLDARQLIWSKYWQLLGVENLYRFDRISGRYHSIKDERSKLRTVYELWESDVSESQDQFSFSNDFRFWLSSYAWLPGANLLFGGSVYVPMNDGGKYKVLLQEGGIKVSADNQSAREAIKLWD